MEGKAEMNNSKFRKYFQSEIYTRRILTLQVNFSTPGVKMNSEE